MQRLHGLLLVMLTSVVGIQAVHDRYSALLGSVVSSSAGQANVYINKLDLKAVLALQLAPGIAGKSVNIPIGGATRSFSLSGYQGVIDIGNQVASLQGVPVSVVLDDAFNTTLQGTFGTRTAGDSISGPYYARLVGKGVSGIGFISAYISETNQNYWLSYAVDSRAVLTQGHDLTIRALRDRSGMDVAASQSLSSRPSGSSKTYTGSVQVNLYTLVAIGQGTARIELTSGASVYSGFMNGPEYWTVFSSGQVVGSSPPTGAVGVGRFRLSEVTKGTLVLQYDVTTGGGFPTGVAKTLAFYGPANQSQTALLLPPSISAGTGLTSTGVWTPLSQNSIAALSVGKVYSTVATGLVTRLRSQISPICLTLKGYSHVGYAYDSNDPSAGTAVVFIRADDAQQKSYTVNLNGIDYQQVTSIEFTTRVGSNSSLIYSSSTLIGTFNNPAFLFTTVEDMVTVKTTTMPQGISGRIYRSYEVPVPTAQPATSRPVVATKAPTTPSPAISKGYCGLLSGLRLPTPVMKGLAGAVRMELKTISSGNLGQETNLYFEGQITWKCGTKLVFSLYDNDTQIATVSPKTVTARNGLFVGVYRGLSLDVQTKLSSGTINLRVSTDKGSAILQGVLSPFPDVNACSQIFGALVSGTQANTTNTGDMCFFGASVDLSRSSVSYTLFCVGVLDRTDVDIQTQDGRVVYVADTARWNSGAPLVGTWNAVSQDLLRMLATGGLAVTVGTPAYLRGTITPNARSFSGIAAGVNQVPTAVQDTTAGGFILGTLFGNVLNYEIYVSGVENSIVAAHLHGPADVNSNAGVAVDVGSALLSNQGRGSTVLSTSAIVNLFKGLYYLNVHTDKNGDGELRGHIYEDSISVTATDSDPVILISALSNGRLTSPGTKGVAGIARLRLHSDNSVEYIVQFSDVRPYGSSVSSLAMYIHRDDDSLVKATDLDQTQVSNSEARGRLFLRSDEVDLLLRNRVFIRINTGDTPALQGQVLYRWMQIGIDLVGANVKPPVLATSAGFGYAELNLFGNLDLAFAFTNFQSTVTHIGLYDKTMKLRLDMTNKLEDNRLSITWPNVRGSDLFNLVASDMYVVVKTQDNPNGELLGWFQCDRMPFEKDYHFTTVLSNGRGGGGYFSFLLNQDNTIDYLFYLNSFPDASTVDVVYFGVETTQVPKTVNVPNPSAGVNSTVSPTITTNTVVSVKRSAWLSLSASPIQIQWLSSTIGVAQATIAAPDTVALSAFIQNEVQVQVKNNVGSVVASSHTVGNVITLSCSLRSPGISQSDGASGRVIIMNRNNAWTYSISVQGLDGDVNGYIYLDNSAILSVPLIDNYATGSLSMTTDQATQLINGMGTAEVQGTTTLTCSLDKSSQTSYSHLSALLSGGGAQIIGANPITGGVGSASVYVSDDGIAQVVVSAEGLTSSISGISLAYYNKTWISLLNPGLVSSQIGAKSIAYVSWKPSESVASLLLTQNVYVVVSTTAFPTGELVGAIRVNARKFTSILASFNASSPSADGGVAAIGQLDGYGLFHVTGYFSTVRYEPRRITLSAQVPGTTWSTELADITSGLGDTTLLISQIPLTLRLLYYLSQGWLRINVYTDLPYITVNPDIMGSFVELVVMPTNVRRKLDFGAVLTGAAQADYQATFPNLGSPASATCLLQLDSNKALRFILFAAGTQPLLNVTVEDGIGNVVAVADRVQTGEGRAVGSAMLGDSQIVDLRNGRFYVRAITRGYPLGEVAGYVGFLRKVYYGSGVPLAKNGFGAYHKTVLDTRGHLLFDVQFSGLTGPLAWVALQQENRNVSFITDSFQSNRGYGAIVDLTADELMIFDEEHKSSYVAKVVGTPGPDIWLDVVEAEDRDVYLAHYSAVISGSQVALADMSLHAVATDASGIMIVFFDENDNLDYRAFILSDDDLTSVGFYGPAGAGYKGPLLYDIPLGRSPLIHGKWYNPSQEVRRALAAGQIYILAKTSSFPNGFLRGQLLLEPHGLFTVLSSNDELHSVTPFGSAGYGEFFLTTYAFLHYRIVVEGINQVVPAHIHGTADFFSTAHHVHTIEFEQQTDGSLLAAGRWGPLGADEVQGLLSGRYYVNVHTPINTAGELRGNVIPLLEEQYLGIRQFEALLTGASTKVVTAAAGHASFRLFDNNDFYYDVYVTGTDVAGLYIKGPGSQSFDLSYSLNGPRAVGILSFSNANDRFSLINGDLYMLVTSTANPNGELRGLIQFYPQTSMAILNRADVGRTAQFSTPVASSGLSIFVFEKDAKFDYRVNSTGSLSTYASTVKQPNWGDRTLTSPNPRYGRSQLVSTIESRNLANGRARLEVAAYVPTINTVLSGNFKHLLIPEPIQSLLYGRPFVDGALVVILDPASVSPPSLGSYLSAGGVVYLSFNELLNSLHYAVLMDGITGPLTKAVFHDRTTGTTLQNILPAIGSDSYNGYKVGTGSIIIDTTLRSQFSNDGVCLQIESATSLPSQTSVIRGCINNEFVFPPCYDSGRIAWIAENRANALVTLVNDSFLFPYPNQLNYTLLQGKWSWWTNDSLFQDVPVGMGRLMTAAPLDYEMQHQHNLTIGMIRNDKQYCTMTLLVDVVDVNDNAPYFIPDGPTINKTTSENSSTAIPVADIYVNDFDSPTNGNPTVTIQGQWNANGEQVFNFYISNDIRDSPGQNSIAHVMTYQPLDYDLPNGAGYKYSILLVATDAGTSPRTNAQYLDLWVDDINDNPPVFDLTDPGYALTLVDETHAVYVPFRNYTVTDADSGSNAVSKYSVIAGAPSGLFDAQPSNVGFHLALLQPLNHESRRHYLLTIQADNLQFTATAQVNITVLDIPFKVEIRIPCEVVLNTEYGWFLPSPTLSLTFESNQEDGVTTVPQFECRFIDRSGTTPTATPPSGAMGSSAPSCGRGYFPTPQYDQPPPLSLDSLSSYPFQNCSPPNVITNTQSRNFSDGVYEFQVRTQLLNIAKGVTDYWGNAITVTIDTVAPNTIIDTSLLPTAMVLLRSRYVTNNRNPAFVYYSNEPKSVFLCRLSYCSYDNYGGRSCDGGWQTWSDDSVDCNNVHNSRPRITVKPTDLVGKELDLDGWYLLEVTAIDPARNPDASPATFTWEMDTAQPIVGFQSYPARTVTNTDADVLLLKNDLYASYRCRVNGTSRSSSCSSGTLSISGMPFGAAEVTIWAEDEPGNVADQIQYTFHVETSPPPLSLAQPDQYAFTNTSDAIVYLQTEGVYQHIACRNRPRNDSLLQTCCRVAFAQDEVSKDCLSNCLAGVEWPSNDVCRPFEYNYTTCLQTRLANLPDLTPSPSFIFLPNLCDDGTFDMGRTIRALGVYTFEVYAQDQAGNPPVRFQKNYVYDPRFVSVEQAIRSPIQSKECPSLPVDLIYLILVAVSWALVLITVIIFIIACKRQRSGPKTPKGRRPGAGGAVTRMTRLSANRVEAPIDISQFDTQAYDDVAPDPVTSEKALIGAHMETEMPTGDE